MVDLHVFLRVQKNMKRKEKDEMLDSNTEKSQ
jgi:hypothetical protein